MVSKQTNLNYPAQRYILSCSYEGMQVPIDAALRIESRYFIKLAATPQAKGMVRSLFVSMQALSKGGNVQKAYVRAQEYLERYPNGRRVRAVQLYGGIK